MDRSPSRPRSGAGRTRRSCRAARSGRSSPPCVRTAPTPAVSRSRTRSSGPSRRLTTCSTTPSATARCICPTRSCCRCSTRSSAFRGRRSRRSGACSRTRWPWDSAASGSTRTCPRPSSSASGTRRGAPRSWRATAGATRRPSRRSARAGRTVWRPWPSGSRTIPSNQTRFLTFTREPVAPAAPAERADPPQDVASPLASAQAGHARRGAAGLRVARRQPHLAPVAAGAHGAVDVPLLRRRRGCAGRAAPRGGDRVDRGARDEARRPRQLPRVERRNGAFARADAAAGAPPTQARHAALRPAAESGRHADHGARRRDRRRPAGPDRRALLGRGRGDAPRGRGLRRPGGRRHAPRRGLQAAHVAVRLPGPRRARPEVPGRGAGEDRPARGHGGALLGGGSGRRPLRRRAADRRAQHAELRAAARGGPRRQADPPEAGRRRHDSRSGSRRPSTSSPTAIPRSSCASGASGRSSGRRGTRST